jgi:SAM-dependent methyltransferase
MDRQELESRLRAYRRENWRGVQTDAWQDRIVLQQLDANLHGFFDRIQSRFGLPARFSFLDIGSGIGNYVLAARERGIEAYGVEPDRIGVGASDSSLRIACDRAGAAHPFASAVGEALPFADESFDLVTLNQVVEHVQDVPRVLGEALRVLRPGGVLLVATPNYLSFYEPHYKLPWFPLLPRPLANLYLRVRGRDPAFLRGITYVTRGRLDRLLARLPCSFEDDELVAARARLGDWRSLRNPRLRRAARGLELLGLTRAAVWMYVNFFVTGLRYAVRKHP